MHFSAPTWYDKLPSTNTTLCDMVRRDPQLPSGTVIAVHEQTAGKGRQGHKWISCPGRDLCFSFLVKTQVEHVMLSSLPMAAAIGVSEFISTKGIDAKLKWPNDVMVNNRKISGILVDTIVQSDVICAVVGIGVNINMTCNEARDIAQPATSIYCETGMELSIEAALTSLLPILASWISRWQESGFSGIRNAWSDKSHEIGERIILNQGRKIFAGVLAGFDSNGQILLKMDDGGEKTFSTGSLVVCHG